MTGKNQKAIYQKKLKEIVRALVKGYKPEKIILFGSMLKSKNPNDIDLFIIKDTPLARLGDRANEAREYLPDQTIPVDFIVYPPQQVKHEVSRGNVFIAEILEKGKLLYEEKD